MEVAFQFCKMYFISTAGGKLPIAAVLKLVVIWRNERHLAYKKKTSSFLYLNFCFQDSTDLEVALWVDKNDFLI